MKAINPLYILNKNIQTVPELAVFKPKLLTYDDVISREIDTNDYEELSSLLFNQIVTEDEGCWDTLLEMGRRRATIVKTLYHVAVFRIGTANIKLVNTVFSSLDSQSSFSDIVYIISEMLLSAKSEGLLKFFGVDDDIYAFKINMVMEDRLSIAAIMKECKDYVNNYFYKLEVCDKAAWVYPYYIKYKVENDKTKNKKNIVDIIQHQPPEELMKIVRKLDRM